MSYISLSSIEAVLNLLYVPYIGAITDVNLGSHSLVIGGASVDATRSMVINGNVRVSDQSNIVAVTGIVGSVSINRVMFHAENVTPWTPTLSTDTALYGMWAAPNVAPTATTFSMTATGLYGVPVVSSSAVGARLSITGTNTGAYRTSSNDLSSYASNSLIGIRNAAGNYLGPPGSIVTGTAYGILNSIYNFNGTITTAYGYYGGVNVGTGSGSANPVIGTYYAIRLVAPSFANGGSITTEWGISQESTTALNYLAGATTFGSSIQTAAPTGGTAAPWKLGSVVTGIAATLVTTSYLQVDVGGTLYKLALVTSVP
jgi:hypothetical protein